MDQKTAEERFNPRSNTSKLPHRWSRVLLCWQKTLPWTSYLPKCFNRMFSKSTISMQTCLDKYKHDSERADKSSISDSNTYSLLSSCMTACGCDYVSSTTSNGIQELILRLHIYANQFIGLEALEDNWNLRWSEVELSHQCHKPKRMQVPDLEKWYKLGKKNHVQLDLETHFL